MSRGAHWIGIALVAVLATACGSTRPAPGPTDPRPRYHTVKRGETVYRIARNYGSSVDAIVRANSIRDVTDVRIGTRLFIPPSNRYVAKRTATRYRSVNPRGAKGSLDLEWPLKGTLTSRFGMRGKTHHDGLDIQAPPGTRIHAAASGRVVHSDATLAGYGNMVIVKHQGSVSTVYAHNKRNLVRVGQFVEKGQAIAEVGRTGRATAPHLHFEVRRYGKARDPLQFLVR